MQTAFDAAEKGSREYCACGREVAGKVGDSVKNVVSSIVPGTDGSSDSSPAQRRQAQVVREDPPDVQLRTAVRGEHLASTPNGASACIM